MTGPLSHGPCCRFYKQSLEQIAARSLEQIAKHRGKSTFAPSPGAFGELAGYLNLSPTDYRDRFVLPADYANHWRKYRQFYNDIMTGLSFVCCSRLEPAQKLYPLTGPVPPIFGTGKLAPAHRLLGCRAGEGRSSRASRR